jgi:hypothetical protein
LLDRQRKKERRESVCEREKENNWDRKRDKEKETNRDGDIVKETERERRVRHR